MIYEVVTNCGYDGLAFTDKDAALAEFKARCEKIDAKRASHGKLWRRWHEPDGVYLYEADLKTRYPTARYIARDPD